MKRNISSLAWFIFPALLGLFLAACGATVEPAAPAFTSGAWQLQSGTLDGQPIPLVGTHPINLSFTDPGMLGGIAACNHYGGSYALSGSDMTISAVSQTEMACIPEEAMALEAAYLAALIRSTSIAAADGSLTLTGEGVELVFTPLAPVPTAELTGRVWVLDGLIQGDAISSVGGGPATLELLSDGSLRGSTGCRTFTGEYVISGAEVAITSFSA